MCRLFIIIAICAGLSCSHTIPKPAPKPLKQNWGHLEVRPGAYMFYWAYFRKNYAKYPIVLWLQGGPGIPSSGVGNFLEVGPMDVQLKEREFAWTKAVSVVFVDSPIGTGFSYAVKETLIPNNSSEIAEDLVVFLKKFYNEVAEALTCPLYIFGEGYGAKIGAKLAVLLNNMILKKKMHIKFAGVALGGAWISPSDAVENYGRFLYSNSLIDNVGFSPMVTKADEIKAAISKDSFKNATKLWTELICYIQSLTNGVNMYNILDPIQEGKTNMTQHKSGPYESLVRPFISKLEGFMNGEVKSNLSLNKNITWGNQTHLVWKNLENDLMTPGIISIEYLLNRTKIPVIVYNGQLDLLVPSIGTEYWVQSMKWAGAPKWVNSKRVPILNNLNHTIGYYKKFKSFSFYWVLRAGQMVSLDAPESSFEMMKKFVGIK